MFQITDTATDPARLTQSILQIRDLLNLYNAELARILKLQCADVGRLGIARHYIEKHSPAWHQAILLRSSYQMLYEWHEGNGVVMNHWLRKSHPELKPSPLLLMVDHGGLQNVHDYLQINWPDNPKPILFLGTFNQVAIVLYWLKPTRFYRSLLQPDLTRDSLEYSNHAIWC